MSQEHTKTERKPVTNEGLFKVIDAVYKENNRQNNQILALLRDLTTEVKELRAENAKLKEEVVTKAWIDENQGRLEFAIAEKTYAFISVKLYKRLKKDVIDDGIDVVNENFIKYLEEYRKDHEETLNTIRRRR